MVVQQLSHICFKVSDLIKSKYFFRKIMKMRIAHTYRNKQSEIYGYFFSSKKNTFIEIFKKKRNEKLNYKNIFLHISFRVKNIKKTSNYFNKLGYKNTLKRGNTDKTLQSWIKGPEGIKIEFQQYDKESKLKKFIK